MDSDPFDDLLGLEDKFYDEGFQLGRADGAKAGRIEGRAFGLEKGFEKYVESGRLHVSDRREDSLGQDRDQPTVSTRDGIVKFQSLPELPHSPRLEKHLKVLYALTEPISLSTENSEEAVSDFDDRQKRAIGKMKIIERLVGEEGSGSSYGSQQGSVGIADAGIEDVNILKARY